jgi:hypothetical protein
MQVVEKGSIVAITLLTREYAPNLSGPRPSANRRVITTNDKIVIIDVIVVDITSPKKGLALILKCWFNFK